jgi:Uma2 family endonuclease
MTVDEYFRFDEGSPIRHEYVSGEVYAMSGATVRHNVIALNIGAHLLAASGASARRVVMNDMRVQVADDVYYYPDVVVVCARVAESDVVVRGPCVVVEVTSPATARIDRSEKLAAYRGIAELRAYLIVDHRRRRVERHWRDATTAEWLREEIVGEGRVPIPCLDTESALDTIYQRVELPVVGEPEPIDYET